MKGFVSWVKEVIGSLSAAVDAGLAIAILIVMLLGSIGLIVAALAHLNSVPVVNFTTVYIAVFTVILGLFSVAIATVLVLICFFSTLGADTIAWVNHQVFRFSKRSGVTVMSQQSPAEVEGEPVVVTPRARRVKIVGGNGKSQSEG